jgi:hypothetical protein
MSEPEFDPEAILRVLLAHRVRFVLIGGVAARLAGSPVLTRDIDICYARDAENLAALVTALRDLRVRLRGPREEVPFRLDTRTLQLGDSFTFTSRLGDLDILATPTGTRGFDDLAANAESVRIGDADVLVASVDDLIRMKRAAGRPKDRATVEELAALREEIARRKQRKPTGR